jgi:DNA replication initiation complex subunit (GINS family)
MLNFEELDHEFMTEGNPAADAENIAGLIQQNLTPEEQDRLKEMMPVLEEYNMLMVKVHTGKSVEELEKSGELEAFGVPRDEGSDMEVPQGGQMQQRPPPQAVQGQVPQNAPETPQEMPQMAIGGVPPVIQENVEPMGSPGDVAAGPVGLVNDPGADKSGVGDDVQAKSDGFVINAAAVKHAGLKDINEMIQGAKEYAEQKGIKLNFGKTPTGAEDILVSNGEVLVPDKLANIIGYDRLEKINNRGKKETEEKLAAQEGEAPPEGPPPSAPAAPPPPPVLQDQMSGLT